MGPRVLMSPKSSHVEEVLPFSLGRNWLMSPLQSLKGVGGHCLPMFSLVRNGTWLRSRCAQERACLLLVWEGTSHGPSAFMYSPVCRFQWCAAVYVSVKLSELSQNAHISKCTC